MCKFNLLGICSKGSACAFAHASDELKSRPDLSRTRLCRVFIQTGHCSNGKKCTFAHSKDELRATDSFHKTKLCKFWPAGHCTLGAKCRFAHSEDEVRDDGELEAPQNQPLLEQQKLQQQQMQQLQQQMQQMQQLQQYNQQRSQKETYSGCATPEYGDFDTPLMQVPYPAMMQVPFGKIQMASIATTKLASDPDDEINSDSTLSDCAFPYENTLSRDISSSAESYESSTPDFPPNYGEGQKSVGMVPMQRLPLLLVPVQQMKTIEHDTGDTIDDYTGDVEIMQAPVDETPFAPLDDTWQRDKDYQVKNTFISIKDEPTFYPLRCVRSAGSYLTEMKSLS